MGCIVMDHQDNQQDQSGISHQWCRTNLGDAAERIVATLTDKMMVSTSGVLSQALFIIAES